MSHTYVFDRVEGNDAVFLCVTCGGRLNFNLPTPSDPEIATVAVDNGDGTYSTPDNPDQWVSPCIE